MPRRSLVVPVLMSLVAASAWAQQAAPPRVRREIPGFDFRKDGVWRRQARAVRAQRARLLSRGNFGALNAPRAAVGAPLGSGPAVSGVLRVPAVLFRFKGTPASQLPTTVAYNQGLFGVAPGGAAAGRPYPRPALYPDMAD